VIDYLGAVAQESDVVPGDVKVFAATVLGKHLMMAMTMWVMVMVMVMVMMLVVVAAMMT
jgi:hypothetical protein